MIRCCPLASAAFVSSSSSRSRAALALSSSPLSLRPRHHSRRRSRRRPATSGSQGISRGGGGAREQARRGRSESRSCESERERKQSRDEVDADEPHSPDLILFACTHTHSQHHALACVISCPPASDPQILHTTTTTQAVQERCRGRSCRVESVSSLIPVSRRASRESFALSLSLSRPPAAVCLSSE